MALDMTGAGSAILGGVGDIFGGVINNAMAKWREDAARKQNFEYNEMAADNADARTRALYHDLQSPAALLQQYQEAGLSPSLMFGGSGAGGSVPQGAEGSGASGVNPQTYGINPLGAAQLQLMQAQARKTNAEANNLEGKGAMGEALLANTLADTQKKLADAGYTKAAERLAHAETALQEFKLEYEKDARQFNLNACRYKADILQYNVDKAFFETMSAGYKVKIERETLQTRIKQAGAELANVYAEIALKGAQKELTKEQKNYISKQYELSVQKLEWEKEKFETENEQVNAEREFQYNKFEESMEQAEKFFLTSMFKELKMQNNQLYMDIFKSFYDVQTKAMFIQ